MTRPGLRVGRVNMGRPKIYHIYISNLILTQKNSKKSQRALDPCFIPDRLRFFTRSSQVNHFFILFKLGPVQTHG
jgi:hypothetical protein